MRLGAKGALTLISISMSLATAPAFSSPLAAGEAEERASVLPDTCLRQRLRSQRLCAGDTANSKQS